MLAKSQETTAMPVDRQADQPASTQGEAAAILVERRDDAVIAVPDDQADGEVLARPDAQVPEQAAAPTKRAQPREAVAADQE